MIYTFLGMYVTLGQTYTYTYMSGNYYKAVRYITVTNADGEQFNTPLIYIYNETTKEYLT